MAEKREQKYEKYVKRSCKMVDVDGPSIFYSKFDAVVSIFTQTISQVSELQTTVTEMGTGFFVDKELIVTAAHNVLYNNIDNSRVPPPRSGDTLAPRVGEIWVTVSNVNAKGNTYVYPADIVGLSPSLDIAVLKIRQCLDECLPKICEHQVFSWGCSRKYIVGEPAYVIADRNVTGAISMSEGIITDDSAADASLNFTDPDVYWGFEGVISDVVTVKGNSGGPLVDRYGAVDGVISGTYNYDDSCCGTIAVSQHVAEYVARTIIKGPRCNDRLELVYDDLGNYYKFIYGWLGILGFFAFNPQVFDYVPDSKYCRYRGFIITELDPEGPLATVFPNVYVDFDSLPPYPQPTPDNEIYLITAMKGECDKRKTRMGVIDGTYPFTDVTMRLNPGCKVWISYYLGSENFACCHTTCVVLAAFPDNSDLPPPETFTVSNISVRKLANLTSDNRLIANDQRFLGGLINSNQSNTLSTILSNSNLNKLMELLRLAPAILSLFSDGADSLADIIEKISNKEGDSSEDKKEDPLEEKVEAV